MDIISFAQYCECAHRRSVVLHPSPVSLDPQLPVHVLYRLMPSGEIIESALVLDKAYLPVSGDSSQNIISTGRLFALQGVEFIPNDVMALIIKDMHAKATLRNFSPFLEVMIFDEGSGTSLRNHFWLK
jgi:hypothetical protein